MDEETARKYAEGRKIVSRGKDYIVTRLDEDQGERTQSTFVFTDGKVIYCRTEVNVRNPRP